PIFEKMKKEPAGRQAEYSVLKDDFFVISGQQNLKRFYVRAQLRGNEVRGLVEYASGVAVAQGIIATDREALEGCYVVTVSGIGGTDRLAEDKDKGIALLRVFGTDLKPVALAEGAKSGDVTLV